MEMDEAKIISFLSQHPKHAWTPREIAQRLKVTATSRKELRNQLKHLSLQGKIVRHRGGKFSSCIDVPTLIGSIKIHAEGYGFLLPDDKSEADVFIPSRYIHGALPGDKVSVQIVTSSREGKREGRVVEVVTRSRAHWVGRLEKRGKTFYVVLQEGGRGIDVLVPPKHLHGARIGQTVVVKITQYHPSFSGEILDVLGEAYDEKTESMGVLVKHDIQREFPGKVLSEVGAISDVISEEDLERRVDLRDKPILTIDGITARDFDDAIYVEKKGKNYHLYVSIADVAHYVRPHSLCDAEALSRGTSVYFPDFAVPMLPEKLSNNLCSLKAGVDRLTLTCEICINQKGEAVEATYYESIIKSEKRGIYDDVQAFFDASTSLSTSGPEDEYSPQLRASLSLMKELANLLMEQRKVRGSIDFDLPEAQVVYDKEGKMAAITKASRFFSNRLIEEFMIQANVAVAKLFTHYNIPALYRVHDFPDAQKIESFFAMLRQIGIKPPHVVLSHPEDYAQILEKIHHHPMETFLHHLLLRSMKIAVYDGDNRGHFGLNLKDYCHFTSPIRRYPDLIVHRQLKNMLHQSADGKITLNLKKKKGRGGEPEKIFRSFYTPEQINYFGDVSSKREREAMEAEREMLDLKRALFMRDHLREKFFGTVRRVLKFGMFVELAPHFVEGLLHVTELRDDFYVFDEKRMRLVGRKRQHKAYSVGDRIWVTVKDVSIDQRSVLLALPEK